MSLIAKMDGARGGFQFVKRRSQFKGTFLLGIRSSAGEGIVSALSCAATVSFHILSDLPFSKSSFDAQYSEMPMSSSSKQANSSDYMASNDVIISD